MEAFALGAWSVQCSTVKKGVSCVHVKIYFSVIRFNLSLLLLLVLFEGHIGQS